MSIHAHLSGSVRLPGGSALVHGDVYESRRDGSRRALLLHGDDLEVHDLEDLFAGERAPAAVFPMPWPGWGRGGASVSPDGTFAVFSGQRAVRAVGTDGTTRWEYRHACWGPVLDHEHTGDEQQLCEGYEHGSVRVSDDGRFVWAHVMGEEYEEMWAVLDARDGRELARLPLDDSAAAGSHHLAHPDGVHMGLCIGMGQDGILLYWARWDGERATVWDLNETLDRILLDAHPAHEGFLTVEHYGSDLRLHALDGAVLAEREQDEEAELAWDYAAGFVDGDTVIATTGIEYEDEEGPRHWLLTAGTLETRGSVTYPCGPVDSLVRPLGDGSWLTYDEKTGTLNRWTV
ncbi:hypothetical protein ACF07V_14385 [Streptomyces sp. NPDC015661]|uniref:hypothetical protein n=1 Tax=Streptomyces sp. NPDC015661 TaxID=3364961 RepID=UPI0037029DE2